MAEFFNFSELRFANAIKIFFDDNLSRDTCALSGVNRWDDIFFIPYIFNTSEMSSPASYRPYSMYDLSGRVALVTGGGTGIGLMSAQGLASCGAKVYITGRRLDLLEKVSAAWDKQIGGEILPYVDR